MLSFVTLNRWVANGPIERTTKRTTRRHILYNYKSVESEERAISLSSEVGACATTYKY